MYSRNVVDDADLQRGTVEVDSQRVAVTTEESSSPVFSFDSTEANTFRQTLRAFLSQQIRLFENPPNKTHLTIGGETVCHYNARAPPARYPAGVLTGTTDATVERITGEQEALNINPERAIVPLTMYPSGILPQVDICTHCVKQLKAMGLIPNQDGAKLPGTQTPPCPVCGDSLQLHERYNGKVTYIHSDGGHNHDCPTTDAAGGLNLEQITKLTKRRLGIQDAPIPETHTKPSFPSSVDDRFIWNPKLSFTNWVAVSKESDNKNIPQCALLFESDETDDTALLFPDLTEILTSDAPEKVTEPPTIPEDCIVIDEANIRVSAGPESRDSHQDHPSISGSRLTPEVHAQAVKPLQLSSNTEIGCYEPDAVEAFVNHYTEGSKLRETTTEYTMSSLPFAPGRMRGRKPPSRHYHQRILNPTQDEIRPLLSRLGITSPTSAEDPTTHLVYGGFTGELADALARERTEVIFTDPIAEWCEAATERGNYDAVKQSTFGAIPADDIMGADTAISFECYHPIETVSGKTIFNLLKGSATTHGLLLVVSAESREQMKNEKGGDIQQRKSSWKTLEQVYDLEVQWAESDAYRIWNLQPQSDTSPSAPRAADMLTIRRLAELGMAKWTNTPLSEVVAQSVTVPYSDNLPDDRDPIPVSEYSDKLLTAHPMCETSTELARSIGRLGSIFNSIKPTNSTRSNNIVYIGRYEFKLNSEAKQYIRAL